MTPLYIAIEGPIGVGKSSLTTLLSKHLGVPAMYEIVEENPFLSDFYADIEKWSFQTEMFFLCHRYKELSELSKDKAVVSDYHILKNKVFAKNTLNYNEYDKFIRIYDILTEDIREPDATIFLTADLDTLKKRIAKRARDFEQIIEDDYLIKLTDDYKNVYESMKDSDTTLLIDTTHLDFVNNPQDFEQILQRITARIGEHNVPNTK
ncbi:deoxynucleoside kinase [Macrococcoides bohemicum]|uniref:Deoxynucleoside kinase n=1 Tax=Macrococcoides bohemicum TaxID=1903056 RepID=A0A328A408_9STAP|nr:deoxynucleoside kinase [Macrococcus bohemicus]RAK48604.1 deoxynucleoside kinase [Macrococcus bohemicus]